VGKAFAKTSCNYIKFIETQEAADFIKQSNYIGYTFFLKGSRGMKMESLVDLIS